MRVINALKTIMVAATFLLSCDKEDAISKKGTIEDHLHITGNITKLYISPGAQESNFGGFVDTYSGKIYLSNEVNSNFHNIDLYFRYTKASGNELFSTNCNESVFLSPDLEQMQYAWPFRNRGDFYILKNANATQIKAFNDIKSKADISSFNASMMRELGNPLPVQRLANLAVDDLILFHSSTKNTISAIKVLGAASNTRERLALDIKTDVSNRNLVPKAPGAMLTSTKPADIIELTINVANGDENYIDLKNRRVYKEYELPLGSLANITLIHTFNGAIANPRQSLFAPGSSFLGSNYSATLYSWLQLQGNKKDVIFLSVSTVSPSHADLGTFYSNPGNNFDQIKFNNQDLLTTADKFRHPSGSTWTHVTTLAEGMVLRVEDRTLGDVGFVKILEMDNVAKTLKIAVKYTVPER